MTVLDHVGGFVDTASGSEDLQVTDQPARKFADEAQTRGDRRKEAQMRALQSVAPVEYGWTQTSPCSRSSSTSRRW